jgi:type III secretory pathway component EscT
VCLGILLGLFLSLTVWALPGGVFLDPKTGDYGLYRHVFSEQVDTRFT